MMAIIDGTDSLVGSLLTAQGHQPPVTVTSYSWGCLDVTGGIISVTTNATPNNTLVLGSQLPLLLAAAKGVATFGLDSSSICADLEIEYNRKGQTVESFTQDESSKRPLV
jgi:hypothetical protein